MIGVFKIKPFKTIQDQMNILEKRKLDLGEDRDWVYNVLITESYYSIINGYKDLFLSNKPDKNIGIEEEYKQNAHFGEIYELYKADKKIKLLLLEIILNYESYLKTKSAYYFAEAN